jgi:hypothetical protein
MTFCCVTDRDIWLLASGGQDGVASLGDSVEAGSAAAIVVNSSCFCFEQSCTWQHIYVC